MSGDIQVIQGDALDILPTLPQGGFAAVIADPPYGSNFTWDQASIQFQEEWISRVPALLKEGGSFYSFYGSLGLIDFLPVVRRHLEIRNLIVWHHPNLYGANQTYGKDRWKLTWEAIVYAVKGKSHREVAQELYYHGGSFDVIIQPAVLKRRLHKAQKPLGLMQKLIVAASAEGDTILDPFGGSGTTAVACKLLRRKCVIIEKDPEYYNIIVERVARTPASYYLF